MKEIDIVCIIDDDPIYIFGAKRMLELAEFCNSFLVFNNGLDAINRLKPILQTGENVPQVILLDLNMPIMDGWEFLDEFTTIKTDTKITIFIVSSSIDPLDHGRAKTYQNVTNFIVKPINPDKIKQMREQMQLV